MADDASFSSTDVIAAINAANPAVLTNVARATPTDSGDTALQVDAGATTASIPTDPSDGITVASDGSGATSTASVSVGLPSSDSADTAQSQGNGIVSYDNGDGSTTVPVVKKDASVEITTVIANASAPTRYDYPVSIDTGGSLQVNSSGGVDVLDGSGKWVAGFAPAWAKDANGANVPTHYEVNGTTLTQVVDDSGPGVAFPVVADPWLGITLIDHVTWETVSKWSPTLAVTPTWWGRYGAGVGATSAAWDEIVKKAPKANTATMKVQFQCHFVAVRVYAPNKPTWDLDSKRPNTSLTNEINHKCNYPDASAEW